MLGELVSLCLLSAWLYRRLQQVNPHPQQKRAHHSSFFVENPANVSVTIFIQKARTCAWIGRPTSVRVTRDKLSLNIRPVLNEPGFLHSLQHPVERSRCIMQAFGQFALGQASLFHQGV